MKVIVLVVIVFVIKKAACSLNETNFTRIKRQFKCFKCKSGECIDADLECDGTVNCKDESDETDDCKRINCPTYLFRCNYGACINQLSVCDGKKDCRDNSDETTTKCKREIAIISSSNCNSDQFHCKSGQCISIDDKCDGKADCDDASDETKEACSGLKCPRYTFTCYYGACVSGKSRCNGLKECYDGSDEANCGETQLSTKRPSTIKPTPISTPTSYYPLTSRPEGSCILPSHPQNGKWIVQGSQNSFLPGNSVTETTAIQVSCQNGYVYINDVFLIFCIKGEWTAELGSCEKICPPIVETPTTQVSCTRDSIPVNCSSPVSGTVATIRCVDFYEDRNLELNNKRICYDGSWDYPAPNCLPVCGKKSTQLQTLIVEGNKTKKGDYPWQIALYDTVNNKKRFICGGSLISFKIVMTAAHCVTDSRTSEVKPKDIYSVAAGKFYSDFYHENDIDAQVTELEEIHIPTSYKGYLQNYRADIAILVTKKPFQLTNYIQFICLTSDFDNRYLDGTLGIVTGWGTESTDILQPSTTLKELEVPYVSLSKCDQSLPSWEYLTDDKFCAGYLNEGKNVCKGDSGGALVFKNLKANRYFAFGIVSVSPKQDKVCNVNQYALYTKVSTYYSWIDGIRRRYKTTYQR